MKKVLIILILIIILSISSFAILETGKTVGEGKSKITGAYVSDYILWLKYPYPEMLSGSTLAIKYTYGLSNNMDLIGASGLTSPRWEDDNGVEIVDNGSTMFMLGIKKQILDEANNGISLAGLLNYNVANYALNMKKPVINEQIENDLFFVLGGEVIASKDVGGYDVYGGLGIKTITFYSTPNQELNIYHGTSIPLFIGIDYPVSDQVSLGSEYRIDNEAIDFRDADMGQANHLTHYTLTLAMSVLL